MALQWDQLDVHLYAESSPLMGVALGHNMEFIFVVTGGSIPRRLAEHFRTLMAEGVSQRLKD
jgi:hypothetical protein